MDNERERELYWRAFDALEEIVKDGCKTKAELLEELDNDLND